MQVARLAGIPVRLHWSFGVLVGFYALSAAWSGGVSAVVSALVLATVLFGSVLLHELGHALAARGFGVGTAHITLYPFGGIAALRSMPRTPRAELVIALAGPLVNVAIVGASGLAWLATGWQLLGVVAGINLVMALFNLIPAFPMDGGRVLRAALVDRLGFYRASDVAMRIGRAFAWAFVVAGALWPSGSLLLVGAFLHLAIGMERRSLAWAALGARWGRPRAHPL